MAQLVLNFSAPQASWGTEAIGTYRTTKTKPTKSAIIGLVASALGYRRGDKRISELFDNLNFEVIGSSYESLLEDYQLIHYDPKKSPKIAHKEYLTNVHCKVVLIGDSTLLHKIEDAIKHPYFAPYLGRRNCPPAGIIKTSFSA